MLDSSLTFKSHIGRTLNTCSTYVFTLAKIRKYITSTVAVQIYKSLVMSRLNFGGMLCLGAPKTSLSRLQKLQNRALRICLCGDRYTSYIQLHVTSNVLPLYLRRNLEIYKCMYLRMLSSVDPHDAQNTSSVDVSRAVTRYSASRPPNFTRPHSVKFLREKDSLHS